MGCWLLLLVLQRLSLLELFHQRWQLAAEQQRHSHCLACEQQRNLDEQHKQQQQQKQTDEEEQQTLYYSRDQCCMMKQQQQQPVARS